MDESALKNKVFLVTGAAQGIGRVLAEVFSERGARVVLGDRQASRGRSLERDLRKRGREALFVRVNLRNERDIRKIVTQSVAYFGRLDGVINNARPLLRSTSFKEGFKEWDLAMDVLLKAPALTARYAAPHLARFHGVIVNIVSTNAWLVSHQPIAYHVAKAGLVQLTRCLAYEMGPQGVRVNAVAPGLVDLEEKRRSVLTKNSLNRRIVRAVVPLKRASSAREIAEAVLFLCRENSSYITGQVLTLDGGLTLVDQFHAAYRAFHPIKDF